MESGKSSLKPEKSRNGLVKLGIVFLVLLGICGIGVFYLISVAGSFLLPPMLTPEEMEQVESDISVYLDEGYLNSPVFTADGNNILYIATTRPEEEPADGKFSSYDWEYDIWIMDNTGDNQTRITDLVRVQNFGYDPVSGKVAFTCYKDQKISVFILRNSGSQPEEVSGPSQYMYFSSWSSDGTRFAATGLNPGDFSGWSVMDDGGKAPSPGGTDWSRLYIMNSDGSDPKEISKVRIPGGIDLDTKSSWSPEGKALVFPFYDPGESGLAVADADTGEIRKITINEGPDPDDHWWTGDYYPVWNPDGNLIVFIREGDVWTILPDGTGEQKIVSDGTVEHLSWNPDGTRLAFSADSYLGIVDPDGENLNRISNIQPGPLSWSPDGKTLTYAPGMGKRIRIMSLTPGILKLGEHMAKQMDVFSGQ